MYRIWTIRGTSANEILRVVQGFTNFYNNSGRILRFCHSGPPGRTTAQNIGEKCKNRWRSKSERDLSVGSPSSPTTRTKSTVPPSAVPLGATALSARTAGIRQPSPRPRPSAQSSKPSPSSPSPTQPVFSMSAAPPFTGS